jgi:hypothetical protein
MTSSNSFLSKGTTNKTNGRWSSSGPGKSTYPLSANANVLSAPLSAVHSNVNVNLPLQCYVFRSNVTLACYQQEGRVGSGRGKRKYVGVNGKWVH